MHSQAVAVDRAVGVQGSWAVLGDILEGEYSEGWGERVKLTIWCSLILDSTLLVMALRATRTGTSGSRVV